MFSKVVSISGEMRRKLIRTDQELDDAVLGERAIRVQTVNLHHLYLALKFDWFEKAIHDSDAITADGWPIQLLFDRPRPNRVTGSAFVERLLQHGRADRVAIVGANPSTGDAFVNRAREVGTLVVFREHGDLREWRPAELARSIEASHANLVIVAVSPPFGEETASRLKEELPGCNVIAVGGAIDMVTGAQVRAPRWVQKLGLEWAARMLGNPRRLARRYLIDCLPVFLFGVIPAAVSLRLGNRKA